MPCIQLKLNTTGANAEDLSDALMEAGAVSITFQDTHDTPVFEPLPGETRLWGDTDVIGLFDAETDMNDVVAILENHPLLGAGFAHKIEQLEDKDWEREWMDNFHPMRFGERLWSLRPGLSSILIRVFCLMTRMRLRTCLHLHRGRSFRQACTGWIFI